MTDTDAAAQPQHSVYGMPTTLRWEWIEYDAEDGEEEWAGWEASSTLQRYRAVPVRELRQYRAEVCDWDADRHLRYEGEPVDDVLDAISECEAYYATIADEEEQARAECGPGPVVRMDRLAGMLLDGEHPHTAIRKAGLV